MSFGFRTVQRGTLTAAAVVAACTASDRQRSAERSAGEAGSAAISCADDGLRRVVGEFGERLRDVSLLAPDSVREGEIRGAYAPYVTPGLLESWIANPDSAPGRRVSSPWPQRILIDSIAPSGTGGCTVTGSVAYVTSADDTLTGGVRVPVTLRVTHAQGWRIDGYAAGIPTSAGTAESSPNDPEDVLRRYYAAVNAHDYRTAFELWGNDGASSGQSFERFAAGFANTARVVASVGAPGAIEGAAGSRYITVPVSLRATTKSGEEQRFSGTYTLRRAVVDGASPAQRRWHIYSARLRATSDSV